MLLKLSEPQCHCKGKLHIILTEQKYRGWQLSVGNYLYIHNKLIVIHVVSTRAEQPVSTGAAGLVIGNIWSLRHPFLVALSGRYSLKREARHNLFCPSLLSMSTLCSSTARGTYWPLPGAATELGNCSDYSDQITMKFFLLCLWSAAGHPTFYSWQMVDLLSVWMGPAGLILFPTPPQLGYILHLVWTSRAVKQTACLLCASQTWHLVYALMFNSSLLSWNNSNQWRAKRASATS